MGLFFNRKPKGFHAPPEYRKFEDWVRRLDLSDMGFAYYDLVMPDYGRENVKWVYGIDENHDLSLSCNIGPEYRLILGALMYKGKDPKTYASGSIVCDIKDYPEGRLPKSISLDAPTEKVRYPMEAPTFEEFDRNLREALREGIRLIRDRKSWRYLDPMTHAKGVVG